MTHFANRSVPPRLSAATLAAVGLLTLLLAGCGGGDEVAATTAALPPLPATASRGAPALSLRGRVDRVAASGLRGFDIAALEALGARRIEVDDPIEERHLAFIAVPLRTVLDDAGPDPRAAILHAWALDDYSVDIPMSLARDDDAWLATRTGDGAPLRLEDGGPLRVVFTSGSVAAELDSYWIWSVAIMTVT